MERDVDVLVVGAGVVGLAVAAALARAGRSVVIAERDSAIARGITSRNSEVIHAGIYYPAGSLKATLCVAGREALYARCEALRIPHERLGKLIVATEESEEAALHDLLERGRANGVSELRLVDGAEVAQLEPEVRSRSALLSPETGIVDGHALSLSYAAEAESHGATLALRTEVEAVEARSFGYAVAARNAEGERNEVLCGAVVNAAGLGATAVAECAGFDIDACGYRLHPCKGDYFALAPGARLSVRHLVYPVPAGPGLGIHLTRDLAGRIKFGPDAHYVDVPHYDVDPAKADAFARAAQRYLPALEASWLTPDYAGVRPKLSGPGEPFRDFVVAEESARGCPAFVNCLGIESPGLTAAGAIADRVVELLSGL